MHLLQSRTDVKVQQKFQKKCVTNKLIHVTRYQYRLVSNTFSSFKLYLCVSIDSMDVSITNILMQLNHHFKWYRFARDDIVNGIYICFGNVIICLRFFKFKCIRTQKIADVPTSTIFNKFHSSITLLLNKIKVLITSIESIDTVSELSILTCYVHPHHQYLLHYKDTVFVFAYTQSTFI